MGRPNISGIYSTSQNLNKHWRNTLGTSLGGSIKFKKESNLAPNPPKTYNLVENMLEVAKYKLDHR